MGALLIHIFDPFSTYPPSALRARVSMPPASEPKSGSVRPKQPSTSPVASLGSHFARCASVP